jgi:hypothetical protein
MENFAKIIGHKNIKLTPRCNTALLCALYITKKKNNKPYVFIPDQGGWLTYKTLPGVFGFEIKELKTTAGIVDLKFLKDNIQKCAALIIKQPAGYFAHQPLDEIYKITKGKCILITDITGSIGDPEFNSGEFSDIMIGSFGKWKPLSLNFGGFLSTKDKELYDIAKPILDISKVPDDFPRMLSNKLKELPEKWKMLKQLNQKVKKELANRDIVHRFRQGVNVLVRFKDDNELNEIKDYCQKNNYPYIICPNYTRLNSNAVSIELKRLEVDQ